MRIAIIPARGGSKRIPRKNVRAFAGKPIIAYSIEAAQHSGLFDNVIVSTDDEEIAQVARDFGAATPFMRPPELSDDYTGTTAVVAHAVKQVQRHGREVDAACCIYATAPLIAVDDLRAGHARLAGGDLASGDLAGGDLDYVFSATRYAFPPQRALLVGDNGRVAPMFPKHSGTRSQDLPPVYHDAAQFYWGSGVAWTGQRPIYGPRSGIVELPHWRVQDIDTPDDWTAAELIFSTLEGPK